MPQSIIARGVRVHNLKNIDVEIPTRRLVVITGVSGSGKSSLAFDTLYAEGQRRYVESLSAYARQFLERIEKPDVQSLEGICPAVAIRQKAPSRNPRSTVGTSTEILDFLRLVFARIGRTTCPSCGEVVSKDTPDSVTNRLMGLPEGTRVLVGFPVHPGGTPPVDLFERLRKRGFTRLVIGHEVANTDEIKELPALEEALFVLVDRLEIVRDGRSRLAESLETAFADGGGSVHVRVLGGATLRFSERFECARCGTPFVEPEPRLFSFNNPYGACPTCHGFGNLIEIDQDLVVPHKGKSLAEGAIEPWNKPHYRRLLAELRDFARRKAIPMEVPWSELREDQRRWILEGDGDFQGVVGFFRWLETKKYKVQVRVLLSRYRGYQTCPACQGARLRPEALQVWLGGRQIDELCALAAGDLRSFFLGLSLDPQERAIGEKLLGEITRRLDFLCKVGLGYLSLKRPFGTLSGGEAQRIALATSLGTGLVGTLYVLDEPSIGLHPRDTDRLVEILKALRDQGNTVLVVEHDRAIMRMADHIIDLGPGAGEHGGRVMFQGTFARLCRETGGLTGQYLRGEARIPVPPRRRRGTGLAIEIRGAREHNLQNIDVRIPLGSFTCVTGVSGSGKSTLVHDVLCGALMKRLGRWERSVGAHDALLGGQYVDEVVLVDQSPIGRTPRSNPVTYLKAFDGIRELFAETPAARNRGLTASHFSFNVPGGRCEVCGGDGSLRIDMQFLADMSLICEACQGRRYTGQVLEVRYRSRNINQVLEMTIREALQFFASHARIVHRLKVLDQIGLGYLRLGQPAATLSGGEAQRIKLAAHLLGKPGGRVLYVLDEPTTGLHMADVNELSACFQRLLDTGATLVVIEHNLDVIKQADWVIDLGPEGGKDGGRLVFQGTPEALAGQTRGFTTRYLRAAMNGARGATGS